MITRYCYPGTSSNCSISGFSDSRASTIYKECHSRESVSSSGYGGFRRERDSAALALVARDEHLYKALFQPGGLEDGTELGYYSNSQVLPSYHFGLQVS
jgi:hypothetical protein